MLPSLGFNEIIILGILALVVVGPKDLPLLFRKLGKWTAKLRGMAQEFRTGFDELARQAELDELKKDIHNIRRDSRNRHIGIIIGGPMVISHPDLVASMGADMMSADATTAPQQAHGLIEHMKSRK